MKNFKEVLIYTAESPEIAEMLVEKLKSIDIPARLGDDSAAPGVFGTSSQSRTIMIPEGFEERAKEVLQVE